MTQETLEEAAENYARKQCDDMYDDIAPSGGNWGWETSTDFIAGAKWQQERSYSEIEDFINWIDKQEIPRENGWWIKYLNGKDTYLSTKELFEQFKKK
jgi:hypothetical protein